MPNSTTVHAEARIEWVCYIRKKITDNVQDNVCSPDVSLRCASGWRFHAFMTYTMMTSLGELLWHDETHDIYY